MRYVDDMLVFRLHQPPPDKKLQEINGAFGDILSSGQFDVSGPLDEERDEPQLKDMQRLVFHFNRRSLGRLRQLVDNLNETGK